MRKLLVGLLVVGLLAVAGPAMAQFLDPLSLVTSGAVLPYFADLGGVADPVDLSGDISIVEVAAPVNGAPDFHMFFFDGTCVRSGPSVDLQLTANDVELLVINSVKGNVTDGARPKSGLITAAGLNRAGDTLEPLSTLQAVHPRVLWFNVARDFGRTLEPIAGGSFEFQGSIPWNPLRSGATFWAPLESPGVDTTIYFICPDSNIIGKTGAFAEARFPALIPAAPSHALGTSLFMRVYDDNERFLRNIRSTCSCLTPRSVGALDPVYSDHALAPNGTYTEVEANEGTPSGRAVSFTGYRAIVLGSPGSSLDLFGRLSNGWRCAINLFDPDCTAEFADLGTTR